MQQIINFIIRHKTFLLFFLLFLLGIAFTINSHSYHKSKFINSANFLTGGVYNSFNNLSIYFKLKSQNNLLQEENNHLRNLLFNSKHINNSVFSDSAYFDKPYQVISANVIKNSYSTKNNVILINKGLNDSIKEDYGVITSKGILGIIDNSSRNYSTVISILNTTSKISAQLQKTNHFGSLTWNGEAPNIVQLIDVEKIAPVTLGDTIVTSGRSSIFPKGIPIGTIKDFELDIAENYYAINVKLFNDMTNLEHVYIIENRDIDEITKLLNE